MTTEAWLDPWAWKDLLRVRRRLGIASACMAIAIIVFVPTLWVLFMPRDTLMRPDLTHRIAWIGAAICALCAYGGHGLARKARAQYDHAIYGLYRGTRSAGIASNVPLDTDIGEIYPPVPLSRQHRVMGIAGPTPLLIGMDEITSITIADGTDETGLAHQPHLVFHLKRINPDRLLIVPGRGLSRANLAQIEILRDRFNEFLEPHAVWNAKHDMKIDMAAFVESMRPTGSAS